jgi:hypothetical protein
MVGELSMSCIGAGEKIDDVLPLTMQLLGIQSCLALMIFEEGICSCGEQSLDNAGTCYSLVVGDYSVMEGCPTTFVRREIQSCPTSFHQEIGDFRMSSESGQVKGNKATEILQIHGGSSLDEVRSHFERAPGGDPVEWGTLFVVSHIGRDTDVVD